MHHCYFAAEGRSRMNGGHSAEKLAALGLLAFSSKGTRARAAMGEVLRSPHTQQLLVQLGAGLPALPKRLVERVQANEYVEFMEFPPARGKAKPVNQDVGGHIVVLQAAELMNTRKIIPDLGTWMQCFAIYTAIILQDHPERAAELMAYQSIIAKASSRYKWPSWVIYDSSFQQEMSGITGASWAKVDPSIYSLCVTGQASAAENWCPNCHTVEHTQQTCPIGPRKRQRTSTWSSTPQSAGKSSEVCRRYNRFAGDCKFGRDCRYKHACSACGDPHPISKCKASSKSQAEGHPV